MPMHDWTKVDAGIFHALHHGWIFTLTQALNRALPSDYYAPQEQHAGDVLPDVIALERAERNDGAHPLQGNGLAVAPKPRPQTQFVVEATEDFYLQKQNRIAIRHISGDRLVAVVEILSPGNKASSQAFRQLLEKIEILFEHRIHLLIIDPFPPSTRDPRGIHAAIWQDRTPGDYRFNPHKPLTLASYECAEITRAYVDPFAVGDELRDMPIYIEADYYLDAPLEETYNAAFSALPQHLRTASETSLAK